MLSLLMMTVGRLVLFDWEVWMKKDRNNKKIYIELDSDYQLNLFEEYGLDEVEE